MTNLKQNVSRLALIATLASTPAFLAAQSATEAPADDTTAEQPLQTDSAEAPADETTEQSTDTAEATEDETATDDASDTAEAPAEDEATDGASDTAEAPADEALTDESSDTAEAPADDSMTDESTDTAAVPAEESATDDATDTAAVPADDSMIAEETETAQAPAEEVAKPVEGQIQMQGENTVLADDLIGTNVYSSQGENIGEIDNLIVNLDGSVDGVVIGVGGFLGIGEKWVAVEMNQLSTQQDDMGNLQLITSATKVDLEAAEPFVTAKDQQAAQQAVDTMPVADDTGAVQPSE